MSDNKFNIDLNDFSLFDIDFKNVGDKLIGSLNRSIRRLANSFDLKQLPAIRNPRICVQKPPEEYKATIYKVITLLGGLTSMSFMGIYLIKFIESRWINYLFYSFLWFISFALWLITDRLSKKYKVLSNNYRRYLNEMGNSTVISVRDLASAVHQSEEKTVKDILYMMKNQYFKQARLVEDNSIFILDIPTYKLYKEKVESIPGYDYKMEYSDEILDDNNIERVEEIISQSKISIKKIEDQAMKIENEEMKLYIHRITNHSRDIMTILKKYPDKSYALNKFSDYYLPTAATLAEAYREFESIGAKDEKICQSMDEIRQSLNTIGHAFEKIKVELLGDRAMDVQTDIDTINLLLNQEGYIEDDWSYDE